MIDEMNAPEKKPGKSSSKPLSDPLWPPPPLADEETLSGKNDGTLQGQLGQENEPGSKGLAHPDPLMPPPPLDEPGDEFDGCESLSTDADLGKQGHAHGTVIDDGNTAVSRARATVDSEPSADGDPQAELAPDSATLQDPQRSSPNLQGAAAQLARAGRNTRLPEIPGYEILAKLGQGGMGAVYKARDTRLNRLVAVKVIQTHLDEKNLKRFEREVSTVASLQHPHVAQLYAADTAAQKPYYVMELVEGSTLEQEVGSEPRPPQQAAELVATLAQTIAFCHEKQIIHRDLKPSNVLLDPQGRPKLTDFGLAKMLHVQDENTRTGDIMGTPGYMAPEQASGVVKQMGPACDIYGLGAILYRLLTGRAPFSSPDPMQTVLKVLSEDPVPPRKLLPELPRDIETICLKCLEKKTDRRYATATALHNDLENYLKGRPITARPSSVIERAAKWCRRRPTAAALLATAAVLVPLIIVGQWYYSNRLADSLEDSRQLTSQLNQSLDDQEQLNEDLGEELDKSTRLANEGSDFSKWVLEQHLLQLQRLPGTTRLRYDLIGRVQQFLDASTPHVPEESKFIRRHARTYHLIADIQGNPRRNNLGEKKLALENYNKSLQLFERALAIDSSDTVAKRLQIACLLNKSDLVYEMSGGNECDQLIETALKIEKQLPIDWTDDQTLGIRAMVASYEIDMRVRNEQLEPALERSEDVRQMLQEFAQLAQERNDQNFLSTANHEIISADVEHVRILEKMGRYDEAAETISRAVRLAQDFLDARPQDPEARNLVSSVLIGQADLYCKLDQFQQATENYQRAVDIRRQLVAEDADDQQAKIQLALALNRLAQIKLILSSPAPDDPEQLPNRMLLQEALEILDSVTQLRQSLIEADPENRQYKREFWQHLYAQGELYGRDGQYQQAIDSYLQVAAVAGELVQLDSPEPIDWQGLAQSEFGIAMAKFQRFGETVFSEDEPFSGKPQDLPDYKQSLQHIEKSIEHFQTLESLQDLDAAQQAYLQTVEATGELIRETAKKIEEFLNDGGVAP